MLTQRVVENVDTPRKPCRLIAVVYKQEERMSAEVIKKHLSRERSVRLAAMAEALALGAPVAVAAVHISSSMRDTSM